MDSSLTFELNIALIPDQNLAQKHIDISRQLAYVCPAVVRLNDVDSRLALPPHLTLYQVALPYDKLTAGIAALADITKALPQPTLKASGYAYNKHEASFELQYHTTDDLLAWQQAVIDCLNPLRGDLLLDRDPGGNMVANLLHSEGNLGDNIRNYGYAEVGDPKTGGLFRPHVTLNWFDLGAEEPDTSALPSPQQLGGTYPYLGVYLLGPYGTCPQRIAKFAC